MENWKICQIFFAIIAGLVCLLWIPLCMYTPAWVTASYDLNPSMFGSFKQKVPDPGSQSSEADSEVGLSIPESVLDELKSAADSESKDRFGGGDSKVEVQFGLVYSRACAYGICSSFALSDFGMGVSWGDNFGYVTYCILWGSCVLLMVAWIWSMATFCCRCCSSHIGLPIFAGLAALLAIVAVAFYGSKANDTLMKIPNAKVGYSFILAIIGVLKLVMLFIMGLYIVCQPKPPRYPRVQPMYGGYNNGYGYGDPRANPNGPYPAQYYQKPSMGASQPVQYPMT